MSAFDFAVVGRTTWDTWVAPPRRVRPASLDNFGGSGANVAVAFGQLGLRCLLVTEIGEDVIGGLCRKHLALYCQLSSLSRSAHETSHLEISPGKSYRWLSAGNGLFEVLQSDIAQLADQCSRALLVEPVVNSHLRIESGFAYWLPQLTLRVNPEAVRWLLPIPWLAVFLNSKEAGQLEELAGCDLLTLSRELPTRAWVVTDESSPTSCYSNGIRRHFPVDGAGECVLSVGGGDAFAAGFAAADLGGRPFSECIELGHQLAQGAIGQVGCQLSDGTVQAVLSGFGHLDCSCNGVGDRCPNSSSR